MSLSNRKRLLLAIVYVIVYFIISYLFTIGVFSVKHKNIFFFAYIAIGVLFNIVYYVNNKEEFFKNIWRNLIMLCVIIIFFLLIKSNFYKSMILG